MNKVKELISNGYTDCRFFTGYDSIEKERISASEFIGKSDKKEISVGDLVYYVPFYNPDNICYHVEIAGIRYLPESKVYMIDFISRKRIYSQRSFDLHLNKGNMELRY